MALQSVRAPVLAAITRNLSPLFATQAVTMEAPSSPISQSTAETQHTAYVRALESCIHTEAGVVSLPASDNHPDCVFVEDSAVCLGGRALITSMGHESRRGEQDGVHDALTSLGVEVGGDLRTRPDLPIDGGDVLWTGPDIFVGLSSRTSSDAIDYVANVFDRHRVTAIPVAGALHLKSLLTALDDGVLAVSDTEHGRAVFARIDSARPGKYRPVWCKDTPVANCVVAGNTTLYNRGHASARELFGSRSDAIGLDASEVEKADGLLTCCSIIVHEW